MAVLEEVIEYEMSGHQARLRSYWEKSFKQSLARINAQGLGEAILFWIASGEIDGEATSWRLLPLLQRATLPRATV